MSFDNFTKDLVLSDKQGTNCTYIGQTFEQKKLMDKYIRLSKIAAGIPKQKEGEAAKIEDVMSPADLEFYRSYRPSYENLTIEIMSQLLLNLENSGAECIESELTDDERDFLYDGGISINGNEVILCCKSCEKDFAACADPSEILDYYECDHYCGGSHYCIP